MTEILSDNLCVADMQSDYYKDPNTNKMLLIGFGITNHNFLFD